MRRAHDIGTEYRKILAALELLAGVTYDSAARPAPGTLDCTRFAYAFLRRYLGPAVEPYKRQLHIASGGGPWENIEALLQMGAATEWDQMQPGWWYCQGWRQLDPTPRGGHAWIWRSGLDTVAEQHDTGLILQATNAPHPWVEHRSWAQQRARFPAGVRMVRLEWEYNGG